MDAVLAEPAVTPVALVVKVEREAVDMAIVSDGEGAAIWCQAGGRRGEAE